MVESVRHSIAGQLEFNKSSPKKHRADEEKQAIAYSENEGIKLGYRYSQETWGKEGR